MSTPASNPAIGPSSSPPSPPTSAPPSSPIKPPRLSVAACAMGLAVMLGAAGAAWLATPRLQAVQGAPDLAATVPTAFGDWHLVQDGSAQVDVAQGVETDTEQPYDQTLMRTYANSKGEEVMLALAWGERQRQDVKVHRPEVCYPAQGFTVVKRHDGEPIAAAGRAAPVPTTVLLTEARGGGYEAVRYWIRIGDQYGGDGWSARWTILNEGFRGRIPDGILVRASQRLAQPGAEARAQTVMAGFLSDLTAALPAPTRGMLVR